MIPEEEEKLREATKVYCVECNLPYHTDSLDGYKCPQGHDVRFEKKEEIK